MDPKRFRRILQTAGRAPCVLCESLKPGGRVGIFTPPSPWEFCAAPLQAGKVRSFAYRVCRDCWRKRGSGSLSTEVERALRESPDKWPDGYL